MENNELLIRTIDIIENNSNASFEEEGVHNTAADTHMLGGHITPGFKQINDAQRDELYVDINSQIKNLANSLSKSFLELDNVSEMEIEFGIGITKKLGLSIFELGSNKSIKIKVKLKK